MESERVESGRGVGRQRAGKSRQSGTSAVASGLSEIQRTVGNKAVGRLLEADGGVRVLQRMTSPRRLTRWPWDTPRLQPEEPLVVDRDFQLDPEMFYRLHAQEQIMDQLGLSASVGRGGENHPDDVVAVRRALTVVGVSAGEGIDALETAIANYQRDVLGFPQPDGRVDVGGKTQRALRERRTARHAASSHAAPTPNKKPDFSLDAKVDTLGTLEDGDHVWYCQGHASTKDYEDLRTWIASFSPYSYELKAYRQASTEERTDWQGKGVAIYNFVVYGDEVRCGQPQMNNPVGSFAWLNHNPGNLSGQAKSLGYGIPGKHNGALPTPQLMVFKNDQDGTAAIEPWLRTYSWPADKTLRSGTKYKAHTKYVNLTLQDAWEFYEGVHPSYPADIAKDVGISETTVLDTLDADQWKKLTESVAQHEGTITGWTYRRGEPTDVAMLPAAIREAL